MQQFIESLDASSSWEIDLIGLPEPTGDELSDYLVALDQARGNDEPRCDWDPNLQRFVDPKWQDGADPLDVLSAEERQDLEFAMQTGDPEGVYIGSVVVHGSGRDYDPSDVIAYLRSESFSEPTSTFAHRPRAHRDLREQIDMVEPWHAEKLDHTVWNDVVAEWAFGLRAQLRAEQRDANWEAVADMGVDRFYAWQRLLQHERLAARRREMQRDERQANAAIPHMRSMRDAALVREPRDGSPDFASSPEPSAQWYADLDAAIREREARQAREASEAGAPQPLERELSDPRHADRVNALLCRTRWADAVRRNERWQSAHALKVSLLLAHWADHGDQAATDAEYVIRSMGWPAVADRLLAA